MITRRVVTLIRGLLVATLVVGLLGLGSSWGSTATTAHAATVNCSVGASEVPPDQEEQNLLNLVNSYRTRPYTWSSTLSSAAIWMAHDMADHNYVGHVDSYNRGVRPRLTDCGYSPTAPVGENVTAGLTYMFGDMATLSNWMFDPAQWHLIVGTEYTAVGIGRAYNANSTHKWYWVLVVGIDGSAPPPTATAVPPTATRTPTNPAVPPTATRTPTATAVRSATPTRTVVVAPTPTKANNGRGNGRGKPR
jgi:uncharacterized protein YkwD